MHMQRPTNTKLNQQGFASIVIALILIIVLALFTVGFAQLARREQQTALDKQKAIQAQYAAESGINNAYQDILSGKINNGNASNTQCMTGSAGGSGTTKTLPNNALTANQDINTNTGVSYSCVLVQLNTDNLQIDNFSPGSGKHMLFNTTSPLDTLTIAWGSDTGRTQAASGLDPANPIFQSNGKWKYMPLLEFSITPANNLPAVNPDQYLRDHTFTFYAYPASGGSNSLSYNPAAQGQVVSGSCSGSGPYPCSVKLNNLGGQQYVIHVTDFYDTSNVLVTGTTTSGTVNQFTGEPVIDVTGKARDVLKRLRVRVFTNGTSSTQPDDNSILPNGAVEAQSICKRIQAAPSTADFPQGSSYDTPSGLTGCNLSQWP